MSFEEIMPNIDYFTTIVFTIVSSCSTFFEEVENDFSLATMDYKEGLLFTFLW